MPMPMPWKSVPIVTDHLGHVRLTGCFPDLDMVVGWEAVSREQFMELIDLPSVPEAGEEQ